MFGIGEAIYEIDPRSFFMDMETHFINEAFTPNSSPVKTKQKAYLKAQRPDQGFQKELYREVFRWNGEKEEKYDSYLWAGKQINYLMETMKFLAPGDRNYYDRLPMGITGGAVADGDDFDGPCWNTESTSYGGYNSGSGSCGDSHWLKITKDPLTNHYGSGVGTFYENINYWSSVADYNVICNDELDPDEDFKNDDTVFDPALHLFSADDKNDEFADCESEVCAPYSMNGHMLGSTIQPETLFRSQDNSSGTNMHGWSMFGHDENLTNEVAGRFNNYDLRDVGWNQPDMHMTFSTPQGNLTFFSPDRLEALTGGDTSAAALAGVSGVDQSRIEAGNASIYGFVGLNPIESLSILGDSYYTGEESDGTLVYCRKSDMQVGNELNKTYYVGSYADCVKHGSYRDYTTTYTRVIDETDSEGNTTASHIESSTSYDARTYWDRDYQSFGVKEYIFNPDLDRDGVLDDEEKGVYYIKNWSTSTSKYIKETSSTSGELTDGEGTTRTTHSVSHAPVWDWDDALADMGIKVGGNWNGYFGDADSVHDGIESGSAASTSVGEAVRNDSILEYDKKIFWHDTLGGGSEIPGALWTKVLEELAVYNNPSYSSDYFYTGSWRDVAITNAYTGNNSLLHRLCMIVGLCESRRRIYSAMQELIGLYENNGNCVDWWSDPSKGGTTPGSPEGLDWYNMQLFKQFMIDIHGFSNNLNDIFGGNVGAGSSLSGAWGTSGTTLRKWLLTGSQSGSFVDGSETNEWENGMEAHFDWDSVASLVNTHFGGNADIRKALYGMLAEFGVELASGEDAWRGESYNTVYNDSTKGLRMATKVFPSYYGMTGSKRQNLELIKNQANANYNGWHGNADTFLDLSGPGYAKKWANMFDPGATDYKAAADIIDRGYDAIDDVGLPGDHSTFEFLYNLGYPVGCGWKWIVVFFGEYILNESLRDMKQTEWRQYGEQVNREARTFADQEIADKKKEARSKAAKKSHEAKLDMKAAQRAANRRKALMKKAKKRKKAAAE